MPTRSSFLQADIELLRSDYTVIDNSYAWRKKQWTLYFFIGQFFLLLKHLPSTHKIIVQFGGYWALLPIWMGKLFGVPSCVILHGTDCAAMKRIGFGSLRNPFLKWSCKKAYEAADLLVPVSASLISTNNTYNSSEQKQGVLHHFPEIKTPFHIIPNGVDVDFWSDGVSPSKNDREFIAVFTYAQFELKGGPLILEMSKRFPTCKFRIAGVSPDEVDFQVPKNLELMGRVDHSDLRTAYKSARFHLQLSQFEGFGLALCEAMMCECVPVGSSVNAIPEIIGNNGYILDQNQPDLLEKIISEALSNKHLDALGKAAKTSIVQRFSLSNRKTELLNLLQAL